MRAATVSESGRRALVTLDLDFEIVVVERRPHKPDGWVAAVVEFDVKHQKDAVGRGQVRDMVKSEHPIDPQRVDARQNIDRRGLRSRR